MGECHGDGVRCLGDLPGDPGSKQKNTQIHSNMKLKYLTPLAVLAFAAPALADHPALLKDQRDKASYSIGVNIGSGIKANALDLNTDALVTGLEDGISGAKPQLSDKEREETLMAFEQDLQKKETEQLKHSPKRTRKKAPNFSLPTKRKKA